MTPDFQSYDYVVVAFSGGKDSLACLLHLLDEGVPRERIELFHHLVDGREGSSLMDWPCTEDYCRKVARALGVPVYYSWKAGGFEREMLREGAATAPIKFEQPIVQIAGTNAHVGVVSTGGRGPAGTRRMFPQVCSDLSKRWCSPYLKIDVAAAAIRNQARFERARTLFVTGERAEESPARSRYKVFERHRADLRDGKSRRHVDHYRPVHGWSGDEVWRVIERHRINPHPAYRLGWGRVSCMSCIFGSSDQWASIRQIAADKLDRIAGYERAFGKTIHRRLSVIESADRGTPYMMWPGDVHAALSTTFDEPVILPEGQWKMPAGAHGESCGPT